MSPDLNLATYVGIDVHPETHTAFAINRFEEERGHLRFENTENGIRQFLDWLTSVEPKKQNLIIGIEGRGGNGQALVGKLLNSYAQVYEVNPLYTKHRRTFGTKHGKTDERDAKLIAEVLTRKLSELPIITREEYLPLRILLKKSVEFYNEVSHQGTRLKNQLHRLRRELKLAADIQEKNILRFIVKEKQAELLRVVNRQKKLVEQFKTLIEGYGKNLTTFTGINITSAAQIMAQVNGIERFQNLDSLILYAGIAPIEKSSGKIIRHKQNHAGNRQLNYVLYMVALVNLQFDPKGKAYYQKKLKEGKTKKHAIRCLMQRIACIIYGMLRSGKNYQEEYQKIG